ncbi:polysaccharide biosynthesis/export family protein [Balneola vulgaris]|uniref:polysaccharide biosynthesis/export family protein n=1 Tax=Balneola vulgaris TaxID=287535 RepID=UPI000379702B|nr:SLBB domain-containing protein [Balneola vulgaris]
MIRTLALLFFTIIFSFTLLAQDISSIDFKNLKADDLSDQQIQQIYERAQTQGLSIQEVEAMAMARGMSSVEVAKLRARFLGLQSGINAPSTELNQSEDRLRDTDDDTLIQRDSTDLSDPNSNKIFGSDLFNNSRLTFEPSQNIPTPKNYVLGAGDELIIDIYGAAQNNYALTISPEGTIYIPSIGPIALSGLSIEEASNVIKSRLSSIYSGLKGSKKDTYAQISLGKVRTIKVHMVGNLQVPGTYSISSLSTVFNALYAAGGPSKNGTYRSIKVIRGGKVIQEVDLYDFLVDGNQTSNIVLQDQDIVKVDPYVYRVALNGETKRTGLFETLPDETFADLLSFAGGFGQQAYTQRIKIRRNTPTERSIIELEYPNEADTPLKTGDQVTVGEILERYSNRVEIQGAVYREGEYQLEENPTLYTLIQNADGLMGDAYMERAIVYRTRNDLTVESIPVNLSKLMNEPEAYDIDLQKDDIVNIASIFDLREEETITISGEVNETGTFPFIKNMTLKDLIFQAKGFTEGAANYNIEVARRILDDGSGQVRNELAEIFIIEVREGLILSSSNPEFSLQPYDQVFVRSSPTYVKQQSATILGEVVFPGSYALKNREYRVSDLIESSGGITEFGYIPGATLNRPRVNDSTSVVAIRLEEILANPDGEQDLLLQPGDILRIPKKLETVLVDGEVLFPSNIRFDDNKSFRSYINSAGGVSDSANTKKSYIVYANGEVKRMRKFLFFKKYPNVEPGSKIIVPKKPVVDKMTTGERVAIYSTIVSLAAIVTNTIFQIRRN